MPDPITTEVAEALFNRVSAFRARPDDATPAADSAALLALFPRIAVRDGYRLDCVQETSSSGVRQPVRPFVRPVDDQAWVPLSDGEPERDVLVEELYQYFEVEDSAEGLFEYCLFDAELWAMRSGHAAEWLTSTGIAGEAAFDAVLAGAAKARDVAKPADCRPQVERADGGGGTVCFLVHTDMGEARIYWLESRVGADGFVDRTAGPAVADLGLGIIF